MKYIFLVKNRSFSNLFFRFWKNALDMMIEIVTFKETVGIWATPVIIRILVLILWCARNRRSIVMISSFDLDIIIYTTYIQWRGERDKCLVQNNVVVKYFGRCLPLCELIFVMLWKYITRYLDISVHLSFIISIARSVNTLRNINSKTL